MKVSKCKLIEPVGEPKNKTIFQIAKRLKKEGERHVIIADKNVPIGIISSVDIVNKVVAMGKNPKEIKAQDIMTVPVYSADINQALDKLYFDMANHNLYSCPVTKNGKFIGSVTLQEVIRVIKEIGIKNGK